MVDSKLYIFFQSIISILILGKLDMTTMY